MSLLHGPLFIASPPCFLGSLCRAAAWTLLLGATLCACQPKAPASNPEERPAPPASEEERHPPAEASPDRRARQTTISGGSEQARVSITSRGGVSTTIIISGQRYVVMQTGRDGRTVVKRGSTNRGRSKPARSRTERRVPVYRAAELDYALDIFGGDDDKAWVSKWQGDLHVHVRGRPTRKSVQALGKALKTAASYAGVKVSYADDADQANVVITFTGLAVIQKKIGKDYWGYERTYRSRQGFIRRSEVWISYARDVGQSETNHIVWHEVGHLFGLQHAEDHQPSVMRPADYSWQELSRDDLRAISMLYRPEVRSGMTPAEAVGVLRRQVR